LFEQVEFDTIGSLTQKLTPAKEVKERGWDVFKVYDLFHFMYISI